MKPIELELVNIGPFTGRTVINFNDLGEMFLVTGKTGSGKTTIFDAITYALYGKLSGARSGLTPRTLHSDFCLPEEQSSVRLDFSVKGTLYRVERKPPVVYTNRNGRQSEKPDSVAVYKEGELVTENKSEGDHYLESLIALTVEEFSRIVLLPQGEFAQFLRENSTKRQETLTKLFPVSLYTALQQKAKEKCEECTRSVEALTQRLKDLQKKTFSTDADGNSKGTQNDGTSDGNAAEPKDWGTILLEAEDAYQAATKAQTTAQNEVTSLEKQDAELEAAILESERLMQKEREKHGLEAQTDEMRGRAERIEKAHEAQKLEPYIKTLEQAETQLADAETALAAADERCRQKDDEKTEAEAALAEIETQKPLKDALLETARDIAANVGAVTEYHQKRRDYATVLDAVKKTESAVKDAEREIDSLEAEIAETAGAKDEVLRLTEKKAVLERVTDALSEAQKAEETSATAKAKATEAEAALQNAEKKRDTEEAIYTDYLAQKEAEERNESAVHLALTLQDGEPCPVCGSTHHPTPAKPLAKVTTDEKLAAVKESFENAEKDMAKKNREAARCTALAENAEKAFHEAVEKLASISQDAGKVLGEPLVFERTHLADYGNELGERTAKNGAELNAATQRSERHEQAQKELLKCRKKHEAAKDTLTQNQNRQTEIDTAGKTLRKQVLDLLARFEEALPDRYQTYGFETESTLSETALFEKAERALRTEGESIAKALEQAENAAITAAREAAEAHTREESERTNRENRAAERESAKSSCDEELSQSRFSTMDEARTALMADAALGKEEETLAHWENAVREAEAAIKTLLEKTSIHHGPHGETETSLAALQDERAALAEMLKTAKLARDAATSKVSETYAHLSALKKTAEEIQTLTKEREQLEDKARPYKRLSDAINGANQKKIKLDSWILGMYLDEITTHASRRLFEMSGSRFTMHLKDAISENGKGKGLKGLDIEIDDYYTGKTRDPASLSGGETFIASLALALALTDVVQEKSGGIQLDSLFIDEGFGSLDEGALENALTILDGIRGNRCVGIISHVSELSSRIPVHLEVEKTPVGSTARVTRL